MANEKITDMTAMTVPVDGDVIEIVDDPSGTPDNQKLDIANLWTNYLRTKADARYLQNVVEDLTPQAGADFDFQNYDISNLSSLFMTERAAGKADVAGQGQFWVRSNTPNEPRFTDDAGTDYTLIPKSVVQVACSDETTQLTTGNKIKFRMPFPMTLTDLRGSLTTAQASGSIFTANVYENDVSILSTLLTIDNNEKTTTTAATPLVISDTALADDAEIRVDITQLDGTGGAAGFKISLIGYETPQ